MQEILQQHKKYTPIPTVRLMSKQAYIVLARCTKKDILLFSVIESIFSFINQESR